VAGVAELLDPITLTGRHVQLEPLRVEHVDGLVDAAIVDRDTYDYTDVPGERGAMGHYVQRLLDDQANGRVLPFAQRRLDTGELVGCTRFMEPRWWRGRHDPDEIEIGGTWLASTAQRTAVNTEAKFLLLSHAFEQWDVWRVAICTDENNARSRTAIERIGATFEGVLRNHRPRYNTVVPEPRDTAVYSITDADWPGIKDGLEQRLDITR
jgi:RimJ/RimL family protein N-acetyltransferase